MNLPRFPGKKGFTLVELLVVIVVVAALATVSFQIATSMLEKGRATKAMQNLREMGPLFASYAADHGMKLPPARATSTQEDGTTAEIYWHEVCMSMLYPDTDTAEFKKKTWWENNKVLLRNPLLKETAKPRGWSPLNPGYGMNQMIAENLALASTGTVPSQEELISTSVPLAAIAEPSRTPLIASCDNFFFRYDETQIKGFQSGTLKDLLSDGKFPVLFVDGHIEAIAPQEYIARKLYLMPIAPPL